MRAAIYYLAQYWSVCWPGGSMMDDLDALLLLLLVQSCSLGAGRSVSYLHVCSEVLSDTGTYMADGPFSSCKTYQPDHSDVTY